MKTIVITLILIAATKNKNCLFLNINKMLDIFFQIFCKMYGSNHSHHYCRQRRWGTVNKVFADSGYGFIRLQ